MLAILAAEQRPLTRVKIIDLLWSDRQEEQARASLRTLLAELKQQFGEEFDAVLAVDRERIALGPAVRTDLTDQSLARPAGELFEGLDHIDPELDEWLRQERLKWAASQPPEQHREIPFRAGPKQQHGRALLAVLLVAALILVGLYAWEQRGSRQEPIIAVLKFRDASGKNADLADGLAEQLRIELGQNPALRVVARASSESPSVAKADARQKAELLGATHLVEGVVLPHDGQLQLSLRLIDGRGQRAIWSTHLPASGPALLLGDEPIAPRIAEVVGQVAGNPADQRGLVATDRDYADYFIAAALSTAEEPAKLERAQRLLLRIVNRQPDFAPALAALSKITMRLSDQTLFGLGKVPIAVASEAARRYASRAIAAAPHYGPGYTAMGFANYGLKDALPYYRQALELNPGSASAHQDWAYAMAQLQIGHAEDRLRHMRIAAQLDPLNASVQFRLIEELVLADHRDEARTALHQYAKRDLPADRRHEVIAQTELLIFGDWSNAYVEALLSKRANPSNATADYLLMWAKLLLYGGEAALPHTKPDSMSHMILKDDFAGLEQRIARLGSEFWRSDYEIGAVGHYLNSRGRSDLVVAMIDAALADGAPLTIFVYPDTIAALREHGRLKESDTLIAHANGTFGRMKAGELKRVAHKIAVLRAQAGDHDGAIAALKVAHRNAWWSLSEILDHPYSLYAFKPLRNDPRFRALAADYDRWVANERAEAVKQAKDAGLPPPPASPPPRGPA